eukprot:m.398011 g.398011  ORF g.398011 m.398011 type:complete len:691 (+) comp20108_c3_seq7:258-2330(+)
MAAISVVSLCLCGFSRLCKRLVRVIALVCVCLVLLSSTSPRWQMPTHDSDVAVRCALSTEPLHLLKGVVFKTPSPPLPMRGVPSLARTLFWVSLVIAARHPAVNASAPDEDGGFIGLDGDNNLRVEAPADGHVLVGGVDCAARVAKLEETVAVLLDQIVALEAAVTEQMTTTTSTRSTTTTTTTTTATTVTATTSTTTRDACSRAASVCANVTANTTATTTTTTTTECSAGTKQVQEPTSSTDRVCVGCDSGTYAEAGNSPDCKPWTDCLWGMEVVGAPTASTDRSCKPCPLGAYSDVANALTCQSLTDCLPGTEVAVTPTSTSDRSCAPCVPGTYSDEANAPTCASCAGCGSCPLGGGPCQHCLFQDETGQTQCKSALNCWPGQRVAVHPTASSDRVCVPCDQGTYSAATNAPDCSSHSDCQPGEGVVHGPSVTSDRKCDACQAGWYSSTANAQCVTATNCEQGEIEWAAPTASSDRQCIPCYDDRVLNCDAIELAGFVLVPDVNQIYYKTQVANGAPVFFNAETVHTLAWASDSWQVNSPTAGPLASSPQCYLLDPTSTALWYLVETEHQATALCVDNNSPVRPLRCESEQAVAMSGDKRVTGNYFADQLEGGNALMYESPEATLLWEQGRGWVIRSNKQPLQDLALFPGVDPLEGDWPAASTWQVYSSHGQSTENANIKARCQTVVA